MMGFCGAFFLAVFVRQAEATTEHKSCWVRFAYSVPCPDLETKRDYGRGQNLTCWSRLCVQKSSAALDFLSISCSLCLQVFGPL